MSTDPTDPELVPLSKAWWEKVKAEYTSDDEEWLICSTSKEFEKAWELHRSAIQDIARKFLDSGGDQYEHIELGEGVLFLRMALHCIDCSYGAYAKQIRVAFLDYCTNNHQTPQQCPPPTNS